MDTRRSVEEKEETTFHGEGGLFLDPVTPSYRKPSFSILNIDEVGSDRDIGTRVELTGL